ncbi:Crp/Fnr family transcriptional regulator [Aquimarina spongiae]|uniref:cAMP-binding domain of CRP or a regulatory subunit of cAMP-dependent protein kinases n=1 Tax=Aquimarina spongiae TaxID=570521 RepID=A0A1M6DVA9_9FLAO|nr:Crp/Fnr family transcriptional regulator [Aquimarina spongiae]SHI77187.1 cAMP-binding domain of CRP or a regulatory subunit of cAMP-dependent protein kinases [Aquimarina spongiae]
MNDIEDYIPFIKKVLNTYSAVSDTNVSLIASISEIKHLKKGEMLLEIGKTSKQKHILYKGVIVSYYISDEGSLYHKNIFLKENFVGSMVSALINEPSNFALEAIEPCILISFDYKQYRQLIEEHTELKDFYIAYLEKKWVLDKEKREINIVLKDAEERYLDFINAHPKIEERIPLHYIASNLGITPTQLSRIRKKIKKHT